MFIAAFISLSCDWFCQYDLIGELIITQHSQSRLLDGITVTRLCIFVLFGLYVQEMIVHISAAPEHLGEVNPLLHVWVQPEFIGV